MSIQPYNIQTLITRSKYIDKYHREIEEGNYFGTYGTYTLAANTHRIGCFKTPTTKYIHMTLPDIFIPEGSLSYEWREGGTINLTGGVAIPVVNYNRNSSNATTMTDLLTGISITVAGTLLHQGIVYGGNKMPGQIRAGVEYVLKPNTYYYLDVLNPTNGSLIYYYVRNWYEEGLDEE